MNFTSKTGLTPALIKPKIRNEKGGTVQFRPITRAAPFVLKPYAGLYNPYSHRCSLLCNHPADNEAKELLKKAKTNWGVEGRTLLLPEEIDAIREELKHIVEENNPPHVQAQVESVPEELFRRYTDTDSRPLTPAPTLTSAATRASDSRRCLTPDPILTNTIREKTLLILDLRRSHSQETLSWYGSTSQQEPPAIRIQQIPTRSQSSENLQDTARTKAKRLQALSPLPKSPRKQPSINLHPDELNKTNEQDDDDDDDDEIVKRRGKKKRKKRDASRGPPSAPADPETQIATIGEGGESRTTSAPACAEDMPEVSTPMRKCSAKVKDNLEIDSFLDKEILKYFRRELNKEVVDNEFNSKRKIALQEALKTISDEEVKCEELINIQQDFKLEIIDRDFWLSLPRIFNKSNACFELPLDSRMLNNMHPLTYLKNHVFVSSPQKLLYNCIFKELKEKNGEVRLILGQHIPAALDLVMGAKLTKNQVENFTNLVKFQNNDRYDFQTFCGLCALCERLLANEFCDKFENLELEPCQEIEIADFQSLTRKLQGKKFVDEQLREILFKIKKTGQNQL